MVFVIMVNGQDQGAIKDVRGYFRNALKGGRCIRGYDRKYFQGCWAVF